MQHREGQLSKEGLAGQPQKSGGVFADGPQKGELLELSVGLANNLNTFTFELVKCIHFWFVLTGSLEPVPQPQETVF